MTKRILVATAFLLSAIIASAQTVPPHNSLSATITDPRGHPFSRAFYQVQLIDSAGRAIPGTTQATYQGQQVAPTRYSGSLDTSGHFVISVVPTNVLSPATTKWQITISAPNAGDMTINKAQAWNMVYATAITADTDLSTQLSAMAQPVNYIDASGPTAFPGVVYGADPTAPGQLATKSYVDAHAGSGTVAGLTNGLIPLATSPTGITANSHLDDGVTTPATITASEPIVAPSVSGAGTGLTGTAASLTAGHANNLPGDFATQSAATQALGAFTTASVATVVSSAAPILDIRHSSFAGGAVCDGVTDIGPALQAAENSIKAVGGQLQIVGSPLPCYWANPAAFDWSGRAAAVTLKITGQLSLGTTFTIPVGLNVIGQSGGLGTQFSTGQTGRINGPNITTTMGTSVTAGTAQVFSPANMTGITTPIISTCNIVSGTRAGGVVVLTMSAPCPISAMGGTVTITGSSNPDFNRVEFAAVQNATTVTYQQAVPAGSASTTGGTLTVSATNQGTAITIVGQTACTISTVARVSRFVTAQMSGACHIPAGYNAVIAGVTDSTYNGTFQITDEDYVLNTLTWFQVGADSSSSGGTAAGVNEDSIETTLVTGVNGANATAYFQNDHASTDAVYVVPVSITGTGHTIRDLVAYGTGVSWWLWQSGTNHLSNLNGGGNLSDGNAGMEVNESFQTDCSFCAFIRTSGHASWGVRLTNLANVGANGTVTGGITFYNSQIMGGVKMDNGGGSLTLDRVIIEQPTRGGIVMDSRNYSPTNGTANVNHFINDSGLQDIAQGFTPRCIVNSLYGGTQVVEGSVDIQTGPVNGVPCLINDYYQGKLRVEGLSQNAKYGNTKLRGVVGQFSDSRALDSELRGEGASMSPAIVPFATSAVIQDPATWPSSVSNGACVVTTGISGPDGTATAGSLLGNVGAGQSRVLNVAVTPAVGDWIIYGGWINTPDSAGAVGANGGFSATQFAVDTNNSVHYQIDNSNAGNSVIWVPTILGDWWHPVAAISQVTSADGSAATIEMQLQCNGPTAQPLQYWKPWVIYVPASAGVSQREIYRWRKQLLHGWVPSNATTGNLYALDPMIAPGVNIQSSPLMEELANNTASGATFNKLACATNVGGTMKAQTCATSSTFWSGVAVGGATGATAGNVQIARSGQTSCIFDGTTVIGDYVQPSATVAGDCHDTGAATYPTTGAVVSRVWTVNSGTGTAATVNLYSPGISAAPVPATCAAGTPGLCAPDGTTITASGGVLTAVGAFTPLVLDFTRSAAATGIGCTGAAPGPYTCTGFPTGTHICTVYLITGGGGGGSGALEASGTNAFGGGGGAGGGAQMMTVPCSVFGAGSTATVTVTVGAGGTGGTAQSTNSTNGVNGGAGGNSLIQGAVNSFFALNTPSSNAGSGGTTTTGTAGGAGISVTFAGCAGGAGSSTTGANGTCTIANAGPGGGAGGGGVNTVPTAAAGGAQSNTNTQAFRGQQLINTTGGTLGGGNGQTPAWANGTPASTTTFFLSAYGGTGGGGNAAGNGGTGGDGMFPGGGGAGGGAALNGSSSGAGGKGGDGFVRVLVQ